jgi:hypothetical protein
MHGSASTENASTSDRETPAAVLLTSRVVDDLVDPFRPAVSSGDHERVGRERAVDDAHVADQTVVDLVDLAAVLVSAE